MNKITSFQGEYRFLSNFWKVEIEYEDVLYPSVEHAYEAMKTTDKWIRQTIANQETAGRAKNYGKYIELRKDWESIKDNIMLELNRIKYCDRELRQKLLLTGTVELIEGNHWHDNYWGECSCTDCLRFPPGNNKLGKILMQIREEISCT